LVVFSRCLTTPVLYTRCNLCTAKKIVQTLQSRTSRTSTKKAEPERERRASQVAKEGKQSIDYPIPESPSRSQSQIISFAVQRRSSELELDQSTAEPKTPTVTDAIQKRRPEQSQLQLPSAHKLPEDLTTGNRAIRVIFIQVS
jgi:hypothetical protein